LTRIGNRELAAIGFLLVLRHDNDLQGSVRLTFGVVGYAKIADQATPITSGFVALLCLSSPTWAGLTSLKQ
jgi:hypothetical protein